MKISVLGSGSSGNSTFIEVGKSSILIDAGFSCKQIEERLSKIGKSLENICALLITHEHTDHIQGAGIISRKYNMPLYITRESYEVAKKKLGKLPENCIKFINSDFNLNDDIFIHPFDVMHDAVRTLGFRLESQFGKTLAVSTDIGHITNNIRENFKNVDAMVIESNYDYQMLMNCSYPWDLKARVKSRNGHLSNNDAARFLKELFNENLKKIFLAHISKDSNKYSIIKETISDEFGRSETPDYEMVSQDEPTKIFEF